MSIVSTPRDQAAFELAPYKSLDNAELQQRIAAVRSRLGAGCWSWAITISRTK